MDFTCSNKEYLKNICGDLLRRYKQGSIYRISYEEIKQEKTLKQLGFIFGGLIKALIRFFENLGYSYEPYMIKDWLYSECGLTEYITLPNGKQVTYLKTLSSMTKAEAAKFIEDIIFFIDTSAIFEDFVLPPELRYSWTHNIDKDKLAFMKAAEINNFDSGYLLHQSKLTCIKCGVRGGMVYHLKKLYTKDYLTLPLCAKCYDDVNTRGESYLQSDIKAVLNGLSLEDFCLLAYHYYRKSFSYSGTP